MAKKGTSTSTEQNELATVVENFARSVTPLPIEREQQGVGNMMVWGDNNLYPNFLIKLYDTVPLHKSITNSKRDYLIGDGLVDKGTGADFTGVVSQSDTATSLVQKITMDWNVFNAFAVAVQYNGFGKPILSYHIPMNWLRMNRSRTKFWTCEDWERNSMNALSYDAFQPGKNPSCKTTIFYYSAYSPTVNNTYPTPSYNAAITNMVIEGIVNEFMKNDLEDGFSAAHIISFFKGMPDSVAGKEFTDKVKQAYSGSKGAKYIIDFNNPKTAQSGDNSIAVQTIDSPDYGAKLDAINKKNETNILSAHQATSRALFGIEQAAGLNGTDLENAYQIFKKVFVRNNRNYLEDGINRLFSALGFSRTELKDASTVLQKTLDKDTMQKVYTIDELRNVDGLSPLPNGDGQKLIPTERAGNIAPTTLPPVAGQTPPAPVPQPAAKAAFSAFGNGYKDDKKGKTLTEADFELVKDMGISRANFAVLGEMDITDVSTKEEYRTVELRFDDDTDVDNWLTNNDISSMTPSEIRAAIKKALGIDLTKSELQDHIDTLTNAGVISTPQSEADDESLTRDVQVVYEYTVRPGFGAKLIATSRGFCKKLISNDRYYSRTDIQQMSAIFGYDVFSHAGGWYYNPSTKKEENQCRHYFKSVRVIKKQTND